MQTLSFISMQIPTSIEGYILEPREIWYPSWVVYVIVLAIAIVGLVRVLNSELILGVFACLFIRPTSSTNFRETMALLGKTFWLLLLNYLIISSVFTFLLFQLYEVAYSLNIILIPLITFLYPIFSLFFVSWLTDEFKKLKENVQIVSMIFQLIGIILIPLTIILMLNPAFYKFIIYAGIAIYMVFLALRLFRGASYAIQNKIPWYYIILYLCTLEILPVGVLYKLLM
jgi:hypothetical protein